MEGRNSTTDFTDLTNFKRVMNHQSQRYDSPHGWAQIFITLLRSVYSMQSVVHTLPFSHGARRRGRDRHSVRSSRMMGEWSAISGSSFSIHSPGPPGGSVPAIVSDKMHIDLNGKMHASSEMQLPLIPRKPWFTLFLFREVSNSAAGTVTPCGPRE